jgi:hypothetical protein
VAALGLSAAATGSCDLSSAIDRLAGGLGIGGVLFHGRVIDPPFHEDEVGVVRALAKLMSLGDIANVHVCHGGPLRAKDVAAWVRRRAGR